MTENSSEQQIKLPFWEIISRTTAYVFVNFDVFIKTSAIWLVYILFEISFGFPLLNPGANIGLTLVSYAISLIATASIYVAVSRNVLLKEDKGYKVSFGLRELKYLGYVGIIFLMITVPLSLVFMRLFYVLNYKIPLAGLETVVWLFCIVFLLINLSRALFVLPAVSVDNKEITLKEAFRLTRGNANRIFWGQFFIIFFLYLLYMIVLQLLLFLGIEHTYVKVLYVSVMILVSYIDTYVRACFLSHVYQYVMFYEKNKKTET